MVITHLSLMVSSRNVALEERVEAVRLLREAADRLERGETDGVLMDINGNRVGDWRFTQDDLGDD